MGNRKNGLKQENKQRLILIGIFAVAAFVFLSLFSVTTSPFCIRYGCDSEMFRMMGRMAHRGMVPYKDSFDHKGPVIMTIEWLGCLISENRIGIFIVQFIFMMFTLITTYKLLRLRYTYKKSLIFTLLMLCVLRIYYEGGNFTEEYCLPFLIWSCYLASKYMLQGYDNVREHPEKYSVFYGITFMIGAFTRLTNAFPVCCLVLVGMITLIRKKKYANLFRNGVAFIIGTVIVALPYIIYFVAKDALYDMVYATFIFNFKYGNDLVPTGDIIEKIKQLAYMLILVTTLVISVYGIIKKKNKDIMGWAVLIMSVVGIIFHFKMRFFPHYYMIYLPIGLMAINYVREFNFKEKHYGFEKILKWVSLVTVCVCVSFFALKNVTATKDVIWAFSYSEELENERAEMRELMSEIEADSKILAYNMPVYFYIETDTTPCYKNFALQDFQTQYDMKLRTGFEEDLKSLEAEYIVVKWPNENRYQEFIDENYNVAKESQNFRLYRLNVNY